MSVMELILKTWKDYQKRKHTRETHRVQKVSANHKACSAFARLAVHSSYSLGMLLQKLGYMSTEAVHQGQWRYLKAGISFKQVYRVTCSLT